MKLKQFQDARANVLHELKKVRSKENESLWGEIASSKNTNAQKFWKELGYMKGKISLSAEDGGIKIETLYEHFKNLALE